MLQGLRNVLKKILPQKAVDVLYDLVCTLQILPYRLTHPWVAVRPHTSDNITMHDVLVAGEYDFSYPERPALILDIGANVGYSSIFFAAKFPNARIVAVEPERSNFAVLEKNTARLLNVTRVNKGLWPRKAHLKIRATSYGHCGFMTEEVGAGADYDIDAVTMDDVLALAGGGHIDILKMDVEGSEKEIFSGDCDAWLKNVGTLVIELHDHMRPGCSQAFNAAIEKYPHTKTTRGDVVAVTFLR